MPIVLVIMTVASYNSSMVNDKIPFKMSYVNRRLELLERIRTLEHELEYLNEQIHCTRSQITIAYEQLFHHLEDWEP